MEKPNKIEVTSMSSRGQVVIPQDIRDELGLEEGEKFIVIGKGNTIILNKIQTPSFKEFEEILNKTQLHAKKHSLKEKDMWDAIKSSRKK